MIEAAMSMGGGASDHDLSTSRASFAIEKLSTLGAEQHHLVSAMSADLDTYVREFGEGSWVINPYKMRIDRNREVKNKITGDIEVVDTLVTDDGLYTLSDATNEEELGGEVWKKTHTVAQEIAQLSEGQVLVWASPREASEETKGKNNRIYRAEVQADGEVLMTAYTLGGTEEDLWQTMENLTEATYDRNERPLLNISAVFSSKEKSVGHNEIFEAYAQSVEDADALKNVQKFKSELAVSDTTRFEIIEESQKQYKQKIYELIEENHDVASAFSAVAQTLIESSKQPSQSANTQINGSDHQGSPTKVKSKNHNENSIKTPNKKFNEMVSNSRNNLQDVVTTSVKVSRGRKNPPALVHERKTSNLVTPSRSDNNSSAQSINKPDSDYINPYTDFTSKVTILEPTTLPPLICLDSPYEDEAQVGRINLPNIAYDAPHPRSFFDRASSLMHEESRFLSEQLISFAGSDESQDHSSVDDAGLAQGGNLDSMPVTNDNIINDQNASVGETERSEVSRQIHIIDVYFRLQDSIHSLETSRGEQSEEISQISPEIFSPAIIAILREISQVEVPMRQKDKSDTDMLEEIPFLTEMLPLEQHEGFEYLSDDLKDVGSPAENSPIEVPVKQGFQNEEASPVEVPPLVQNSQEGMSQICVDMREIGITGERPVVGESARSEIYICQEERGEKEKNEGIPVLTQNSQMEISQIQPDIGEVGSTGEGSVVEENSRSEISINQEEQSETGNFEAIMPLMETLYLEIPEKLEDLPKVDILAAKPLDEIVQTEIPNGHQDVGKIDTAPGDYVQTEVLYSGHPKFEEESSSNENPTIPVIETSFNIQPNLTDTEINPLDNWQRNILVQQQTAEIVNSSILRVTEQPLDNGESHDDVYNGATVPQVDPIEGFLVEFVRERRVSEREVSDYNFVAQEQKITPFSFIDSMKNEESAINNKLPRSVDIEIPEGSTEFIVMEEKNGSMIENILKVLTLLSEDEYPSESEKETPLALLEVTHQLIYFAERHLPPEAQEIMINTKDLISILSSDRLPASVEDLGELLLLDTVLYCLSNPLFVDFHIDIDVLVQHNTVLLQNLLILQQRIGLLIQVDKKLTLFDHIVQIAMQDLEMIYFEQNKWNDIKSKHQPRNHKNKFPRSRIIYMLFDLQGVEECDTISIGI